MNTAIYFEILNYSRENIRLIEEHFELVRLEDPSQLTRELLSKANVLFAPLGYFFGAKLFDQAPRLQVLASNTTGVPHIDIRAAAQRSIQVVSLHKEAAFLETVTPTAELTLGLIICLTRHIIPARESVLQSRWSRWDFGAEAMLSRQVLGIVGLGRLGKLVAGYASALKMDIVYFDPNVEQTEAGAYCKMKRLKDLLGHSDIVTLHADLHERNIHLFDQEAFAAFKKGAAFINTARGELVDSMALIWALEQGILSGAALDVLDNEFQPGFCETVHQHPLVLYAAKHHNLIITPHIAGSTKDAWQMTQRFVITKTIKHFFPNQMVPERNDLRSENQ